MQTQGLLQAADGFRNRANMATELKTDSWHSYVLYRKKDYAPSVFPSPEETQAIEAGKKYALGADSYIWAKDAGLLKRVREFLGKNFHWHDRLAKSGSDSDVVQALMEMVRGGSVVVIPEKPMRSGGATGASKNADPSFRRVSDYDVPKYKATKERYQAQLEKMNADPIPWSEIQSMNDSMNTQFMHAAILAAPALSLPVFARAGWISKYSLPDMTGVGFDRVNVVAGDDSSAGMTTSLGGMPFGYGSETGSSTEVRQLAWLPRTGGLASAWVENPSGSKQMRLYDGIGNAAVDFDFDHDHGFGAPHAHNWDGNIRDKGNAFSLLPY